MSILSVLLFATAATAQTCKLQFDSRFPVATAPADLDVEGGAFQAGNVLGQGLAFSQIIKFPCVTTPSLFDGAANKPWEMTINDSSIFAPSPDNVQLGFRRGEFLPTGNDGADGSTQGVKTLHFSLRADPERPLNFTHEYQLVFLEDAKFTTNQFVLKTGTLLPGSDGVPFTTEPQTLSIFGNTNEKTPGSIFATPFTQDVFHNFGLTLDFTANTTKVLYSQGSDPLVAVTEAIPNIVDLGGQFHFGMLKKPTGPSTDITKIGFQPSNIDEGVIYGGVFMEDSADGCVSLST